MKACRRSDVRTGVGTILFCKNTENAVKKNNSPRFTAFTAKRRKKYAVKIIFFHRISPHFLRKFTTKPRPGYYMLCYGDNCCCLIVVCSKIIQSKEAKRGVILEYIKDYCVYRLQLTPDKEHIPTPNTLLNSCWNTLDDARYTHTKIYTSNSGYQLYQSPDRETG